MACGNFMMAKEIFIKQPEFFYLLMIHAASRIINKALLEEFSSTFHNLHHDSFLDLQFFPLYHEFESEIFGLLGRYIMSHRRNGLVFPNNLFKVKCCNFLKQRVSTADIHFIEKFKRFSSILTTPFLTMQTSSHT